MSSAIRITQDAPSDIPSAPAREKPRISAAAGPTAPHVKRGIETFQQLVTAFHASDPERKKHTTNHYVRMALEQSLEKAVASALQSAKVQETRVEAEMRNFSGSKAQAHTANDRTSWHWMLKQLESLAQDWQSFKPFVLSRFDDEHTIIAAIFKDLRRHMDNLQAFAGQNDAAFAATSQLINKTLGRLNTRLLKMVYQMNLEKTETLQAFNQMTTDAYFLTVSWQNSGAVRYAQGLEADRSEEASSAPIPF